MTTEAFHDSDLGWRVQFKMLDGVTEPSTPARECRTWGIVNSGDTCEDFWRKNYITEAIFAKLNKKNVKARGLECLENHWYCVGRR